MCVSPITIKVCDYRGNRTIQVPCGKCFECLKTKQNDYMVRICEEMMQVPKSCFVTLTYSNDTVPYLIRDGKKFLTVWKDDIKDWIKRFRTNYERKTGIKGVRYFLCSEYGPRTHRPHYHAIFFGLSKADLELALNDWSSRYGYVLAKDVNYSTGDVQKVARYVSKYACKGVFEDPFVARLNLPKPFRLFSKGLGKTYISRMIAFHTFSNCSTHQKYRLGSRPKGKSRYADMFLDEVLKRKSVLINGFNYHLPRYYAEKLFKKEIPLGIVEGSKKKIVVNTPLSVALANRAFELRCQRIDEALECYRSEVSSPYEAFMVSESCSLVSRNYQAQQSLRAFYQRSRF